MRAVFEILIKCFTTRSAGLGPFLLLSGEVRPKRINAAFAAIAHNKRLPFFDSEKRNKEEAEVVIHALVIGLV